MKNVTIYQVLTGNRIHLATLNQNEAETHARTVYKLGGEDAAIPDIMAGEWTPTDHTTPEGRLARAQWRADRGLSLEARLLAGANVIRAARELANKSRA